MPFFGMGKLRKEFNSWVINIDKRLRNKCAMTCGGNMNQNTFNDTDFSLLTKSSFWEIKSDYPW